MAVIFFFSGQPDFEPNRGQRLHVGIYKLAHLIEYGVLGVLVAGATRTLKVPRAMWWAWVTVALYAISDEVHQFVVPGRTPLVTDVAIDALGGLLGIYAYVIFRRIREGQELPITRLLGRRPPSSHAGSMYADAPMDDPR